MTLKELLGISPKRSNITSLLDGTFLMYSFTHKSWGIYLDTHQEPVKLISDKEAKKLIKAKKNL